jgi:formylglycine-generating enzyme required for sulfatase activity
VGTEVLRRVGESIADAALTWGRSPLLVTCRVLDYQAEPLRQLPGFGVEMLAELTNEQIEQFVRDWYAELAASGRRTPPQATDDARALGGAVSAQEELQNLARLPLLLTVMALVHTNRGKLPDTRALLYAECIDLLLLRWRQSGKEPDLLTRIGLSQFRSGDLLKLMAHLGYTAHTQAERLAGEEGPADLSEQDVIGLLAEGFAQYDAPRRYELAGVVLEALASGNGLLLKRGPGVYSFPHRTFQEFLAGYHLSGQRDYLSRCRGHAAQPHWHEALLLMAGYQVHATPSPEPTILLAEKLLADGPQQAALAGELLVLVGSERAAQYDPALVAKNGLWPHARRVLLELATTGTPPAAPAPLRVRAGLAAGLLCYGPLARLCVPNATVALPDARLPLALVGLGYEQHPEWRRALSNYWCHLNAGPFFSGDDRKNTLLRQVRLPYPFAIGRYPVTNAEFVRFVADGGYAEQRWWTEEGWMFLQRGENEPVTGPRLFDHLRYNGPTQPVVGVSWYEAVAYCAWLTAHGHAAGWLLEGDELRLPTSLECERAARHTDTRRYPWGTSPPDAERANYRDSGVNRPSPIGCFPGGTAMCGAQDMVGNVREWLATPYAAEKQVQLAKDFTLREDVLLSYSGWGDKEEDLCCGARDWYGPFYRYVDRSFRLVCSRRSSE